MMSAYSVMDPVNKYRHGVLIGNFVEDKFGNDLNQKVIMHLFRVLFQMLQRLPQTNSCILSIILCIKLISLLLVRGRIVLTSIQLPRVFRASQYVHVNVVQKT